MNKHQPCESKGFISSASMKKQAFKLWREPTPPNQFNQEELNDGRREYERHGTCCLIASLDVVLGKLMAFHLGPTRTEADFAEHIKAVIATAPKDGWIFIADQLNTHKSETKRPFSCLSL